jgi:hypothetical protein
MYSSPDIVRVVRFKTMMSMIHAASAGNVRNAYKIFVGEPRKR